MSNLIDFFNNNFINIGIIIFVVLGLLVIISVKGIDLNEPVQPTHLVQTVTVETFSNEDIDQLNMDIEQGFCASLEVNTVQLEKSCNELTKDNCAEVGCCVYLRDGIKGKCVAGSKNGPIFKTDQDGQMITADRYYYLDNCFGKCPKSM